MGGLGWLLGNQLMWNNLVPLGGELHQFRGNPHYGSRRTEESTISSLLSYIFQFQMSQLCGLKRKFSICCLIINSPSFLFALWYCWCFVSLSLEFSVICCDLCYLQLDISNDKISFFKLKLYKWGLYDDPRVFKQIVFIRPRASLKLLWKLKRVLLKQRPSLWRRAKASISQALFTPLQSAHVGK